MAQGKSGRIVVEIDPDLKVELYVELAKRRLTMKDWLLREAEELIQEKGQQRLWKRSGTNSQATEEIE